MQFLTPHKELFLHLACCLLYLIDLEVFIEDLSLENAFGSTHRLLDMFDHLGVSLQHHLARPGEEIGNDTVAIGLSREQLLNPDHEDL